VAGGAAAATRIKSEEANSEIAPRSYYAVSFVVEKPASGSHCVGFQKPYRFTKNPENPLIFAINFHYIGNQMDRLTSRFFGLLTRKTVYCPRNQKVVLFTKLID
jgi:hypothetical protein